ncbi:MAG: universal stress protein [Phycisphaeraceae bacterium]|nr:universal stress protein [Phycisphaerales bacterium]QOJ18930.1 MAG: universal stress protein [Phycisphaeraceae bacterium]
MLKRILVGLGGTPYTLAAMQHALDLARRHQAETTGVTVLEASQVADVGPVPLGAGAAAAELREHRVREILAAQDEQIARFHRLFDSANCVARVIRETGDPFEELTSLWRYHDLTILGLQGLFEYGVVRDPQDCVVRLIAKGVRPILAVAREHRVIRRVVIAYNGSMGSAKTMKRFIQSRLWDDPEIHIVCFELPEGESRALLHAAQDYCRAHGYEAAIHHVQESPRSGLPPFVERLGADLVVMGSTNRSRLAKLMLGDTAVHMLRHATIPLFLGQ